MGRVVLVTGVADQLAAEVARTLSADPRVDRVVGVDMAPTHGDLGAVRVVRADIRHPVIADLLAAEGVDTVLHMDVRAASSRTGGRGASKETYVIGTMQLLAACQRAVAVRRLVLMSSTAVYGASPRSPAMFSEESAPEGLQRSGYAKDCAEVEGYVRGFGRRRPDVSLAVLRCADVLAADLPSALARYLRLPAIPTVLGFDPRLQLLHRDDALQVLHRAAVHGAAGTFNVAGDGVLTLSQLVRRLGRPALPVPGFGVEVVGRALRRTSGIDLSADQVALLTYGRVVDTTALRETFGYQPRWSTAQTLDDFAATTGTGPLSPERLRRVERGLATGLAGRGTA